MLMLRATLTKIQAEAYFNTIFVKSKKSSTETAKELKCSTKALRDWKNARYTVPISIFKYFEKNYAIPHPKNITFMEDDVIRSLAGKKGANIRNAIHGNPGTAASRKKGGINSLKTHQAKNTGFVIRKVFTLPKHSSQLAEFFGILLGDGSLSSYQGRVTLHNLEDQYVEYTKNLYEKLFFSNITIISYRNILELIFSGKNIVEFLSKNGLVIGNKIKNRSSIPEWVMKRRSYIIFLLRGLFDTDGSVYCDTHLIKNKIYKNICLSYTIYSEPLRMDVINCLKKLSFSPALGTKNRVALRSRTEVLQFFNIVKPANQKHLERFKRMLEE